MLFGRQNHLHRTAAMNMVTGMYFRSSSATKIPFPDMSEWKDDEDREAWKYRPRMGKKAGFSDLLPWTAEVRGSSNGLLRWQSSRKGRSVLGAGCQNVTKTSGPKASAEWSPEETGK